MQWSTIRVPLRDGVMGAYVAIPDRTPAGAIIAIMEIWGVNDTMRRHAHEFARSGLRLPRAGSVLAAGAGRGALRLQSRAREEGVRPLLRLRLRPRRARHGGHRGSTCARAARVQRQGRRGGLLPRRQALLSHVLPHRHRLRGRLLRHLHRAQHPRGAESAPAVHAAHGDEGPLGAGRSERSARAAARAQSAGDDPQVSRTPTMRSRATAASRTARPMPIARSAERRVLSQHLG